MQNHALMAQKPPQFPWNPIFTKTVTITIRDTMLLTINSISFYEF